MPTNKHAAYRYRILNKCFSNRGKRKWTLEELIEEVSRHLHEDFDLSNGISKRTIQGDLNVMRSERPRGFGAPIVCHDSRYFYADPKYSIEYQALGREEVHLLRSALGLLQQLPGMPQLEALQMLLNKTEHAGKLPSLSGQWIQFETNPAVQGLEWLGPLYKSIAEQQVLDIAYHPFTEPPLVIRLHPYLLKEWRNRWYIFGRTEEHKLWNLALDRISQITPAPSAIPYLQNDLFDPETWFADMVGVSKPAGAELVEVQFETNYLSSRYLETRPIHASQRLISVDDHRYRFSLKVILNHELVNELVRFGNDLKIISPQTLQEMLKTKLR